MAKIFITQHFRELFQGRPDPNASIQAFCDEFQRWKAGAVSQMFGKDCGYERPLVLGKEYVLWHVHLMPVRNAARKAEWDKAVRDKRARKTSDRALVYVEDETRGILLISILEDSETEDGGAHSVSEMSTDQDRFIMEAFAGMAERFLLGQK